MGYTENNEIKCRLVGEINAMHCLYRNNPGRQILANHVYECMYILDANAYARNPGGASESIQKMVDKIEGEMLASRLWNEQKLAYPIKGRYKGAYWLSYFRCNPLKLVDFNRACQLNDIILRHLAVKIEPRLVEALVGAAKGEIIREDSAETSVETSNDSKDSIDSKETAAVDA